MRRSIEQLHKEFIYDPIEGTLFKLDGPRVDSFGLVKPTATNLQVRHFGEFYVITHLVWALYHGVWPAQLIDHRDGDKSNIKLNNLREATYQQNQFNKVGYGMYPKGVVFKGDAPRKKPWAAVIRIDGVKKTIGHYKTMEEAGDAYRKIAEKYQGEFALHTSLKELH